MTTDKTDAEPPSPAQVAAPAPNPRRGRWLFAASLAAVVLAGAAVAGASP